MSRRRSAVSTGVNTPTPKLTDVKYYKCGEIRITKKIRSAGDDTTVYFKFKYQALFDLLIKRHCVESSMTAADVSAQLAQVKKRPRMVRSLGLPWPPDPARALRRAEIAIDDWLDKLITTNIDGDDSGARLSPKVCDFWPQFFEYKASSGDWGVARTDGAESAYRLRIGPTFGSMRLDAISPSHIEDWYRLMYRTLAPNTVDEQALFMSMLVRYAVKLDREEVFSGREPYRLRHGINPFSLVKKPAPPRRGERTHLILENHDLQFLLQCAAEIYPTMVTFLLVFIDTGCRWGEAVGLRWSDIELNPGRSFIRVSRSISERKSGINITEGKTAAARRIIPMSDRLKSALALWRDLAPCPHTYRLGALERDHVNNFTGKRTKIIVSRAHCGKISVCSDRLSRDGYVFCSPRNWVRDSQNTGVVSYGTMSSRLKRLKVAAGMQKEGSWHDFRHTFISNAVAQGVDRAWLKGVVGHSNLRQLDTYTHTVGNQHSLIESIYADCPMPDEVEPNWSPTLYRKNT